MSIRGQKRHLTSCVAAIGAVRVGLDELLDGEAVRSFFGGDGNVLAHELVSLFDSFRLGKDGHSRMALAAEVYSFISCCVMPLCALG
jgi:hypothetical protein